MAKQVIRFNYFHVKLINNQNEMFEWDMRDFIEYIIGNKHSFDPSVILGDEISELEWNSCSRTLSQPVMKGCVRRERRQLLQRMRI